MNNKDLQEQVINGVDAEKTTAKKYKMYLAINTHWDREYRWSFVETRTRLVEAVDILIDTMEKDPRFAYFHTDSQASFLDDYLEVRPENTERVKKLVKDGRLLTGPWYTLPAEFLVSGEALVRNLLMGHKIAGNLGRVMKTGYNIFSWGQVSQLPQIYRQFGMDTIMFYRGIDQSNIDKLEFKWKAPDGSEALGITFGSYHRLNFWVYVYRPYNDQGGLNREKIVNNNGFLFNLCDTYSSDFNHWVINQPQLKSFKDARAGLDTLLDTVKDKSSTENLLFLQGFDQENPDPAVPDLVEKLNRDIDFGKIEISDLGTYLKEVRRGLNEKGLYNKLNVFHGEMLNVERSSDPFAPLYIGVFSARMPLKQQNTDCENRLENWAEPAAVWANLLGREYPCRVFELAWRELLQNQQHDGIGGCHVDRITTTMEERYRNVKDLAEVITRDSLVKIVTEIDYSQLGEQEIGVTVFNPSAVSRTEEIIAEVDIPHEWGQRFVSGGKYKRPLTVWVYDTAGNRVESQLLTVEDDTRFAYLKYGSHISFDVARVRIAFSAENIPSMGYACFKVVPQQTADRPVETLCPEKNVLENDFIRAEIRGDGTLELLDKETGRKYDRLHYFEDTGEMGGPLIHHQPYGSSIYNTLEQNAQCSLVFSGKLYATYRIERRWELPEGVDAEMKVYVPHGNEWVGQERVKRSQRKEILSIITDVTLRKHGRCLEFETTVQNAIKDHRLRVCFDTNLSKARYCYADSPFDVVKREIAIPDSSGWYEAAARTLPAHSFIDVNDETNGMALLQTGLPEYEVVDNKKRTIALTLLRCFGTAGNNSETYVPQPLAQCQGKHVFRYAIVSHAGSWQEGDIIGIAEHFNAPMRVVQCTKHRGVLPQRHSFFAIDNPDFIVTALKKAEHSSGYILRGYNASGKKIVVTVKIPKVIHHASKVGLEENWIDTLVIDKDNTIKIDVMAGEIYSILMAR
ncbi:MAG: glycoside hydrolase family 38 C-terminal domain-containing protein [Phycisphaerae bacterium]|jgi:alpha-mannosidase